MKKKFIIPGLLAAVSVVGLAACDKDDADTKKLADLTVSGYTENFKVGESFAKGDLKVEAKYSDDSVVDVTNDSELKITAPTSLSEPGTYAVIVSYGGLQEAYQIKVKSDSTTPDATVKDITVTGAKTDFTVGDSFVTTGLKVEAKYSDDATKDVTSDAKVDGPASLDKVGTYAVMVTYSGITKAYQVNVSAVHKTLDKIVVNTTGTKLNYVTGVAVDDLSYDLSLNYHYEDDNNVESVEVVTDLSGYTKTVTDADGNVVTGTISTHGVYTVTLSKGDDTASFDIVVDPDLSSVDKAIAVGLASQNFVKIADTSVLESSNYFGSETLASKTSAEFGDEYVVLTNYDRNKISSYTHLFKADSILAGICIEPNADDPTVFDKLVRPYEAITEDDFKGHNFTTYTYPIGIKGVLDENKGEVNAYGTDGLLSNLYLYASQNKNGDFKQSVEYNAGYYTYHFSFGYYGSGLKYEAEGFSVYDVSFNLGDNYIFDNVKIVKKNYEETAVTKGEDQHYTLNADATEVSIFTVVIDQAEGVRDLEPTFDAKDYFAEEIVIKDSEGNVLKDGDVFKADLGTPISLSVEANPELASWVLDNPKVNMEGVFAYYNTTTNSINFTVYTAGTYTLEIQTENTFTSITVVVDKVDPETISVQQFIANPDNPNQAALTEDVTELKVALGKPVYLYGVPKASGKAENTDGSKYTMALVGSTTATLERVNCDYKDGIISVWEFIPTEVGIYVIEAASTVEGCEDVKTTVTIEVVDTSSIDISKDIVNGRYVCEKDPFSQLSENLSVTFIPSADGALNGTVALATKYSSGGWGGTKKLLNALYSYSFDADTLAFTFEKISANVEGDIAFNIVMVSDLYEMNVNLTFGNVMISDLAMGSKVDALSLNDWQGTWASEDDTVTLTVEDDYLEFTDGNTTLSGSVVALNRNYLLLLDGSNTIFELNDAATAITCTVDDKEVSLAKPVVEEKFSSKWQGTWSASSSSVGNVKLTITANELTYFDGDITWGGTATVTDDYTITLDDDGWTTVFTISEDGTTISCDVTGTLVTLTKEAPADLFPTVWQGTWTGGDAGGFTTFTLTIGANNFLMEMNDSGLEGLVTIISIDATTFVFENDYGFGIDTYTLTINGNTITFDEPMSGELITLTKSGSSTPDPTPSIEFDDAWLGVYEFYDAVNKVTMTVVIEKDSFTYYVQEDGLDEEVVTGDVTVEDNVITLDIGYYYVYIFTIDVDAQTITDDMGQVYNKKGR